MIRCPNCGESYYQEKYTTSTAIYWSPVYKDGLLMNYNPNTITTHCECLNCGKSFSYDNKEHSDEYNLRFI